MLDETDRRAIIESTRHYPEPGAAGIDALRIVQARHGWISDEHLAETAALLGLSTGELESVATFYNHLYRRPVGRHVILLCDSMVCWMLGQETLRADIARKLGIGFGETTRDGRFTLLPVPCLGACHRAPAMLVDGELYEDLTPTAVEEVLNRHE